MRKLNNANQQKFFEYFEFLLDGRNSFVIFGDVIKQNYKPNLIKTKQKSPKAINPW